jgi:hypothetical protein
MSSNAKSKTVTDDRDFSTVFPPGKIKAQLQNNKDVGKVPKPTEQFIACCSALLLEKLIKKKESSEGVVTLDNIKEAAAHYDFMDLAEVRDNTAPKAKAKKKRKTKEIQEVQEVASQVQHETSIQQTLEVIQDEDDYD